MKTKLQFLLILFFTAHTYAQQTFVPDDNFEQALIDLGLDDVLDNYVLTANIEPETFLEISHKNIADLTGIEDFISLEELLCIDNQITLLDLSQNTALKILDCQQNEINSLNINNCVLLENLLVDENELTTIDITQNLSLVGFTCDQNQLTNLNLSNYTNLEFFSCRSNLLTDLNVQNGNNTNISYFNSSNNLNLTCIFVDDTDYSEGSTVWFKDTASTYVETQAECDALGVIDNELQNLHIYPNPVRNNLNIDFNSEFRILNFELCITDLLGKKVYQTVLSTYQNEIPLMALKSGIYFLVIKNRQTTLLTKKFIKL